MTVRVLIADDDLDTHELLKDVLEISLKDVEIGKALSHESFVKKVREADPPYNLLLLDYHLKGECGRDPITVLNEEAPQLLERTVLLNGAPEALADDQRIRHIPRLQKPYSLDEFGDLVRRVVAG